MSKPRLLDLFCGAGGCSVGYARAGFEVVGVDIEPQPNYPFEFHQADALTFPLEGFEAIHASPPCQAHSALSWHSQNRDIEHPRLISPVRDRLRSTGLPYVIENVEGAPLIEPVRICGAGLGLALRRHRLFETTFSLMGIPCAHGREKRFEIFRHGEMIHTAAVPVYGTGGGKAAEHWNEAMGIDWMTRAELAQAIPPAYTEHIGQYLMAEVCRRGAVGHDAQGVATASCLDVPENDGDESVGVFPLDALGPDEGGLRITELAGRVGHNTVHTDAVGERESGHGPHHALPAPDVKDTA